MPESSDLEIFRARLRQTREERGLTQAELAEKCGLQPSAVSHFESKRRAPSFENLKRLADALNVTIDYLLGREKKPGLAGPVVDQLFRDVGKMTQEDRESLAAMAKILAKKNKPGEK